MSSNEVERKYLRSVEISDVTKTQIKRDLEMVTIYRIAVTMHDGEGHFKVFEHLADASIHISKWIGKAESIQFTRDIKFRKDADIAKLIKILEDV